MTRRAPRSALVAAVVLVTAAACAAAPPALPTSCVADVECPVDARCHQNTCTADLPPRAAINGPRTATIGAALSFDGTASSDADDEIVAYTWSVRVLSASCVPDLGPSGADSFQPVFGCAGEFQVILVVRDRTGVVSDPAIVPVTIVAN